MPPDAGMKYVDWVERVLQATVELVAASDQAHLVGLREIAQHLSNGASVAADELEGAAWTAVEDLVALGLLEAESIHWIKITQQARKVRHGASLRTTWPQIVRVFLEPEQEEFLRATVSLAEHQHEGWADVDFVSAEDVVVSLGWPDDVGVRYGTSAALEGEGLARVRAFMGGHVDLRPTFAGVVRATEKVQTEWQERLDDLLTKGEAINVEFKRQLNLGTERGKAEFVRDVIALANTLVTGPRYLVVGYEPRNLEFYGSLDPSVSQDRLEDILNAWTSRGPSVRLHRIDVPGGVAAVLEVEPDPARLPYLPSRASGKVLSPDRIYVRHATHVEQAGDGEKADLLFAAERARNAEPS